MKEDKNIYGGDVILNQLLEERKAYKVMAHSLYGVSSGQQFRHQMDLYSLLSQIDWDKNTDHSMDQTILLLN